MSITAYYNVKLCKRSSSESTCHFGYLIKG